MKILLLGANGQLGTDLVKVLQTIHDLTPLIHADVDIRDMAGVDEQIRTHHPDLVMNTVALHNVDVCETDIQMALAINAFAVRDLALACRKHGAALLHMSTDYVFGNDKARTTPYTEDDTPDPINSYGLSKWTGEQFIQSILEHHYIVRTSGLYGTTPPRGKWANFVELMLQLAHDGKAIRVVNDQRLSPTYTIDLAHQIVMLIECGHYGIYHVVSHGDCTPYEFAQEIFHQSGLSPDLSPARTGDFGENATRPAYSVLQNKLLQGLGIDWMRHWKEALSAYIEERGDR